MTLQKTEVRWSEEALAQHDATWSARYGAAYAQNPDLGALRDAAERIAGCEQLPSAYRRLIVEHVWGLGTRLSWLRHHPNHHPTRAPIVSPLIEDHDREPAVFALPRLLRRWYRWLSPDPGLPDWHVWDWCGANPPALQPPAEVEAAFIACLGDELTAALREYQRDHEHEHLPFREDVRQRQARKLRAEIDARLQRQAREGALDSLANRHGDLKRLTARYRREFLAGLAVAPSEDGRADEEGDDE